MLRQYVIVPKKPKMSTGKIASQVAHATFMVLDNKEIKNYKSHIIKEWKDSGMCVIVLETYDSNHLMQISEYLKQWHVIHHLYIDEGITEVTPMTATALATEIIDESKEWMFEKFKLFGDKK